MTWCTKRAKQLRTIVSVSDNDGDWVQLVVAEGDEVRDGVPVIVFEAVTVTVPVWLNVPVIEPLLDCVGLGVAVSVAATPGILYTELLPKLLI
jgi:hypothetical protein